MITFMVLPLDHRLEGSYMVVLFVNSSRKVRAEVCNALKCWVDLPGQVLTLCRTVLKPVFSSSLCRGCGENSVYNCVETYGFGVIYVSAFRCSGCLDMLYLTV